MIVHVVFIFITPDTHTVWEIITPNDNERNMIKCEGLNLFRFQMYSRWCKCVWNSAVDLFPAKISKIEIQKT